MHNSQIPDIVLVVFGDNHKLAFPEFLVIVDLVVVIVPFAHFEESQISIEVNNSIFQFFSIDISESQAQFLLISLSGEEFKGGLLQIGFQIQMTPVDIV